MEVIIKQKLTENEVRIIRTLDQLIDEDILNKMKRIYILQYYSITALHPFEKNIKKGLLTCQRAHPFCCFLYKR